MGRRGWKTGGRGMGVAAALFGGVLILVGLALEGVLGHADAAQ